MMIVLLLLVTCLGSLGLITEGVSGRRALANGTVGTLTPTDSKCTKDGCALTGTFASADGTVTKNDVELKDAERIRRSDPTPATVDNVRLDEDATDPTAYTADYNWRGSVIKGGLLALVGLGISGALVMMLRRYQTPRSSTGAGTECS
ncbi:hypothetical protein OHB24_41265 [Kribbella sp. NBC_00482]|uniref:hypothetical protein n=1 Tax=Kribbella sp. NBC_00482 TaxID=2975968 RepID=UPI002E189869